VTSHRVLAVDLGATSIRVAAVDLDADQPEVEVLHRWHHTPVTVNGTLRWDWPGIIEHVEAGLEEGLVSGRVASIGVDGWGVDYGLIDGDGELVDLPYAYRDTRTHGWEATAELLGHDRLYGITGVQLMGINTIFQLAADTTNRLALARHLLLLPDLVVNHLTGWVGCELSNMSTTGLMDARRHDWAGQLIEAIEAPRSMFPEPGLAGTTAGTWRDVPVNLVGSHDTASAFLGVPFQPNVNSVFVSTGSWVIVGVERPEPDTSDRARALNFSNEAGAMGGVRFLKNVVGFWILEQCREAWDNPSIEDLVGEAEMVEEPVPVFDARDHRFVSTTDMVTEVLDATGLAGGVPRAVIVRSIIESIVAGVVGVIGEIGDVTGDVPEQVLLVGGGSRIPLVGELLARQSGLRVVVGSPEATALGNAIVQGISLGRFSGLEEARRWLAPTGVAA
jgi:rhamnulokinase